MVNKSEHVGKTRVVLPRGHYRKFVLSRFHSSRKGSRVRGPSRTMSPRHPDAIRMRREQAKRPITVLGRILGAMRGQ